jgi:hypothetical protein
VSVERPRAPLSASESHGSASRGCGGKGERGESHEFAYCI